MMLPEKGSWRLRPDWLTPGRRPRRTGAAGRRVRFVPRVFGLEDRTLLSLQSTLTAVTTNPTTLIFPGQSVTLKATVTPSPLGSGTPQGGTVQFLIDGVNTAAPVPVTDGVATLTIPGPGAGLHTMTAVYSGDGVNFAASTTGTITTIAGTGIFGSSGDGGPATAAMLEYPAGVAVDSLGNIYFADLLANRVREVVKATGNIITIAGTGTAGNSGDNGPATAATLNHPVGVAVDAAGNVFIADRDNNRVREVLKATGNIIPVRIVTGINGLAIDAAGNLFFTSSNRQVIELVKLTGSVITIAGTGIQGYGGDGGSATSASLNNPQGLALDSAGNLFIADTSNARVREVIKATGIIITVAGNGIQGYGSDGGPATAASFNLPTSVAVDAAGNLYIADNNNYRVREVVKATGNIVTVAGNGTVVGTDGGLATAATIRDSHGVALDPAGNLYIADSYNGRIRLATPAAFLTVLQPSTVGNFDFGTATSPLAVGYTRVTPATKYTSAPGFGWTTGVVFGVDRGTGGPAADLTRDLNFTTDATFVADVANGTYPVTLTLGDTGGAIHDNMAIFLEGVQVDTVSTGPGEVITKTYSVTVNDRQLTLRLQDQGGVDPNVAIEAMTYGTDTTGPQVVSATPAGTKAIQFDHFDLVFNEPIIASSFTLGQVSLTGPGGNIPLPSSTSTVTQLTPTTFRVSFAPQTMGGAYSLTVGPGVTDLAGNPMDQNQNGVNGETPGDVATATLTLQSPLAFDFGTTSSPVAAGYNQVSPMTTYSAAQGYGWTTGAVFAADRATADPLTRDLVYTPDATFVADVPNGTYQVTVTLGDAGGTRLDNMGLFFQGSATATDTVSTNPGQLITKTYVVIVTNNQLQLRLRDLGGTDPNVAIEALSFLLDTTGPQLVSATPTGMMVGPVDHFDLTFNEPILASSFTLSQVSLTGPGGFIPLPTSTSTVTQLTPTTFRVSFAPQTVAGVYSLAVGPGITDLAGNPMNQNGNAVNGETPGDAAFATVTLQPPLAFDFGTASSPVAAGYYQVDPSTTYSPAQGYGWTTGAVFAADRATADPLTRDLVYTPDATFVADVPNGTYLVTVTLGDAGGTRLDNMGLFFQGSATATDTVSTSPGQLITKTYVVIVTNNQLQLRLRDLGGTDPNVAIEALSFLLDTTGPQLVSATPTGMVVGPVDHFVLTFNEPILASSLAGNLTVAGPGGTLTPLTITQLDATTFLVAFAPQTTPGTYIVVVGTGVTDLAGNPMNQNGNGVNGETTGDIAAATFTL